MTVVPEVFRKSGEQLVNYDFTDVLTNSGYVTLYGIQDEADAYYLVRQEIASAADNYRTDYNNPSGLQGEMDFDFTFVVPQYVKGDCFVTITTLAQAVATQDVNCTPKVRIYHVDAAAAETEIGTQQTGTTLTWTTDSSTGYMRTTFTFALNKNFKVGEKLRVNVEIHSTSTTNSRSGLLHDGANRNFGQEYPVGIATDSNLVVLVPFNLGGKI